MATVGTVARIHRYPVKSMQGEALDHVDVDGNGIVGDRTWAVRDAETGKLVSAKRPRLWRSALDCTAVGTDDGVTVALPDGATFGISDPELPAALERLFGRPVTVERSTHAQQGIYDSDWPDIEGLTLSGEHEFPTNLMGAGTSFVDLEVLHLLTTTSVDALGALAPDSTVDVARFRPSVLLDTPALDGFPENEWSGRTLTIGDVRLQLGDPTPRCVMTTVQQPGLARDPSILQAIASSNRLTNDFGSFACLGCYATVEAAGAIEVGAPVTLT